MKKILLFMLLVTSFVSQAQFWTDKATTFSTTSTGVNSISIVDANNIWVKAYDGSSAANKTLKQYARSSDGGNTWTSGTISLGAGTAGLGISSITAVSATTAWISAYPETGNLGGIWKTTNSGTTWTKQASATYSDASSFTNFVYFFDANNGVAMGDPIGGYFEIYTTTNGGTTWTRVPSANIPAQSPSAGEYGYSNNYSVVGSTIWFGTSSGRLLRSSDKGLTWTAFQTPVADIGGTVSASYSFSTVNKGLLVTSDGSLYSSTDGGATWTSISTSGYFLSDIAYIPGTSKVVTTGAKAPNGSAYSLDDGLTWTGIDTTQHLTLAFLNENVGFSGGFTASSTSGGISKYTGTQLTVNNFNDSNALLVSPNPTYGFVKINSSKNTINQIEVTDLLGKQVYQSDFSALNTIDLDLSSLQTGVYLLKASSNEGRIKTVKIVKN